MGLVDINNNQYVAPGIDHATYAPNGSLTGMTNGNGIVTSNGFNTRFQPALLSTLSTATIPTNTVLNLNYNFHLGQGDNGNVFEVINNANPNYSALYDYDLLNRLTQANTTNTTLTGCWGETYSLDNWGNLTNIAGLAGSNCWHESFNAAPASTANQLNGYCYDAAGNLSLDVPCPTGAFTPAFTYDAENRLSGTAGYTYHYDADGARVQKTSGSSGTMYWTGTGGQYLTETDLTGAINEEYIYFNGARLARRDLPSGTVHYYFSDHLGSASVITDPNGVVQEQYYYYPYGGIVSQTGSDPNHYKFTGKERDAESGLDNFDFRYYSSSMGRFMKPDDPFYWNESNPQSLNLYAYVSNNPLSRVDPDGHDCVYLNNGGNGVESVDQSSSSGECGGSGGYWVQGAVTNAQITDTSITLSGTTNGEYNDTTASYSTSTNPSMWEQFTDWRQNFINNWNERIDAHKPPPQKPSNLDPLQYINNIMMGAVPVSPSRGSTGRTVPRDLKEQLAMEQVQSNPGAGKKLPLQMNDPRWPASQGWVKMSQNVNGVEIHYVENTVTGAVDDFKFKY